MPCSSWSRKRRSRDAMRCGTCDTCDALQCIDVAGCWGAVPDTQRRAVNALDSELCVQCALLWQASEAVAYPCTKCAIAAACLPFLRFRFNDAQFLALRIYTRVHVMQRVCESTLRTLCSCSCCLACSPFNSMRASRLRFIARSSRPRRAPPL